MVCLPVFSIFYNVSIQRQLGWLILTLLLATWAYAVIGTMFSALTVNLRLREVMLPTLVYPVMIPALMAAIQLTIAFVAGRPLDNDLTQWFKLLVGFDVIFTSVTLVLIEIVLKG
jgi:heme exporter protein B